MFCTKIKCFENLYFCKWPKSQFELVQFWHKNSNILKILIFVSKIVWIFMSRKFRFFKNHNVSAIHSSQFLEKLDYLNFCTKKWIISNICYAKIFHDLPWYLTISLAHVLTPWINHSMKLHRMPFRVCLEVCYLSYYSSTCTRARDLTQHKKGRTRAQV